MNSSLKFSIIIPVYNADKYVEKCVDSVIGQTYNNIEVIIIDDGSIDNSFLILKNIAELDSRIKILSQNNSGPSIARNIGLENATGDYISFLDADDWLEENAFQLLYKYISENAFPDIIMFNNFVNDFKKNNPFLKSGLYDREAIIKKIYPRLIESNHINESAIRSSVCLRIFKHDLIDNQIKFKSELKNNEDLVFTLESTLKSKSFLYLGHLYIYHNNMTEGSLSRGYLDNAFENMKPLFGILDNICNEQNHYNFKNQINTRVFRTLIFCIENEFRKDNPKTFCKKYLYIKSLIYEPKFRYYLSNYKPVNEKSKLLYFWFYKFKFVIGLVLLAKFRVKRQEKTIQNV